MDQSIAEILEHKMRDFCDKLTEGSEEQLLKLAEEIDGLLETNGQLPTTSKIFKRVGAKGFRALLDARLQAPKVSQALREANEALQAELDASFVIDKEEALAQLLKALEAGRTPPTPAVTAAQLKIDEIDISSWEEFPEDFFNKPLVKSVLGQRAHEDVLAVFPCCFLSITSVSKEKAVESLRQELLALANAPGVRVFGFLAKPSTIELVRLAKPDETPDVPVVVDLKGHQPGKRIWAAFCFVHGYKVSALTPESLREMGISGATTEGNVGVEIS